MVMKGRKVGREDSTIRTEFGNCQTNSGTFRVEFETLKMDLKKYWL